LPESVIDDLVRDQIKERYGTRAALMASLQKKFGISFESFRKQIRDDFIVNQMMAMKISSDKIIISPQKVENYYNANAEKFKVADQVKLRMIVLNKATPQDTAPRKLADEILEKIKAGASFSEMASVYSDSQRSKAGDRGWIERSFFRSEISDVAFSLKAGEHSGVIDLDDACYLLLVEEVRGAHVKPLDELRAEIETTLKSEERARLQNQWINRLKEKAFIRSF
jgi:parvulin-like peptidyl-prolyl isomerase